MSWLRANKDMSAVSSVLVLCLYSTPASVNMAGQLSLLKLKPLQLKAHLLVSSL